ncbi:MAG: protein kinase [Alphaproteobacteria bacterium]|nr:protein kinase [Alphaproteobacteria bacterium]
MTSVPRIGPYVLGRELGRGSAGVVFSARHEDHRGGVALKVLTHHGSRTRTFRAAFRAEARAVAALNHPNVVRLLDQGEVDDHAAQALGLPSQAPFLVMEQVRGGSLASLIGGFGGSPLLRALDDVLSALGHLHARGLVHRDIKPGNVLLERRAGRAMLADFGISQRWTPGETPRFEHRTLGTPNYMPPEQARGRGRDHGPWTDLYALGCLAWALTTGAPPFDHTDPEQVLAAHLRSPPPAFTPCVPVPVHFEEWLRLLLRKAPDRRYPLAADAAWALREVLAGERPPRPGAIPPMPEDWRDPGRSLSPVRWLRGAGLGLFGMREVPFVGREAERDRLWGLLQQVRSDRRPRAVLISGPSGCGKSRLATWLGRRAEELGAAIPLRAMYSESGGPMEGVAGALARHHRVQGLSHEEALVRVATRLARQGLNDPSAWRAICELLVPSGAPVEGLGLSRPEQRWSLLHSALQHATFGRPGVLILEDLQWNADALRMVQWLIERAPPLPLLILITVQDEALATRPAEARLAERLDRSKQVKTLRCAPLDQETHRALVQQLLGLDPRLVRRVAGRTQGFPLFTIQLVGDWVHRGLLKPGPRGFRLPEGTEPPLPDDLHEVWRGRLDPIFEELSPDARASLEVGAVLGTRVDGREWRDACLALGVPADHDAVERLVQEALILPDRGGWRWIHGMLRESVLRCTREEGRWRRLNLAVADMLRTRAGPGTAERLALHLLAADMNRRAIGPLMRAINELHDQGIFDRCVALMPRLEAAAAEVLRPGDPHWAGIMRLQADQLRLEGDLPAAAERFREAAERAREGRDEGERLRALKTLEWVLRHLNRLDEGAQVLAEAETLLAGERDPVRLASWQHSHASWHLARGDTEQAKARCEHGLEVLGDAEGARAARGRSYLLETLARTELARHQPEAAEDALQQAMPIWERLGLRSDMCNGLNILGELARVRGDLEKAIPLYERAFRTAEALGMPQPHRGVPCFNLGLVHLLRDDLVQACTWFNRAASCFSHDGYAFFLGLVHLGLAAAASATRDWEAWRREMAWGEEALEGGETADPDALLVLRLNAGHCEEAGLLDAAARVLTLGREQARRLGDDAAVAELDAHIERLRGPPAPG